MKLENEIKEVNEELNIEKEEETSPTKDLTTGSPMKLIIGFALPMLLGLLFQQFYSLVDTIIVGKFLGVEAFAGVGATGSINFLVLGFCMGMCNGFAIPVAQMFGAKNEVGLRKSVANCIWLCIIFSASITTVVAVFCRKILILMNTPDDIIDHSYNYLIVIVLGIPFMILYNETASILRALGDSKSPVVFLAISSILNIILDLLLIVVVKTGVAGAAWATVIAQATSGIICLIYMKKKFKILKMQKGEMKIEPSYMAKLCVVGVPMGLQYSITGIGTMVVQAAVNGLGSVYVAAVTAGIKINNFLACPMEALGTTMAPYAGQNVGAGKVDRVEKGLKAGVFCGFVVSAVMLVVSLLFGKNLTMLFLEEKDDKVLKYSYIFLIANVAFYFLLVLVNCVRFTIQGMGYSGFAIIAGVLEMIARTLAGAALVPLIGFPGIMFASPLAWLFADAFLIPAFYKCKKKTEQTLELEQIKGTS